MIFRVSGQLRHKPACTATEASYKHEILDIETIEILLPDECINQLIIL